MSRLTLGMVVGVFAIGCANEEFGSRHALTGPCEAGMSRCSPDGEPGDFDVCVAEEDASEGTWVAGGTCDGGCNSAVGTCEDNVCPNGAQECTEDGLLRLCESAIGGWKLAAPCDAGQVCDPTMGSSCMVQVCVPGLQSCDGDSRVVSCNDFGTRSQEIEACSAFDKCFNAACQSACDVAEQRRSFVGCEYYGVDLDNRGNGGSGMDDTNDYDIVVANADAERTAEVIIERRNCATGEWSTIPMGSATLAPGQSYAFILGDTHQEGSGIQPCGAYRTTSTQPIVAYQFNSAIEAGGGSWSANSSTLFPKGALKGCAGANSNQYYAMTRPAMPNADSMVTVVGLEDDLTVNVRVAADIKAGPGVAALLASESGSYQIGAGDVLAFASDTGDMSGTFVQADGPISVFGHHEGARVISTGDGSVTVGPDGVEEQMMPLSRWGKNFVASPVVFVDGFSTPQPNSWKMIASVDDTVVTLTGQPDCTGLPPAPITLHAGEYTEYLTNNNSSSDPCELMIEASEPIQVMQFTMWDSYDSGDPAMITVVPVEQWLDRYAFLAPPFFVDHARIVRHAGAEVFLNGTPITGAWSTVGGDFQTIALTESGFGSPGGFQESNIISSDCGASLKGDCGVGLAIFGTGGGCAYGYIGGLNLECINEGPN